MTTGIVPFLSLRGLSTETRLSVATVNFYFMAYKSVSYTEQPPFF